MGPVLVSFVSILLLFVVNCKLNLPINGFELCISALEETNLPLSSNPVLEVIGIGTYLLILILFSYNYRSACAYVRIFQISRYYESRLY